MKLRQYIISYLTEKCLKIRFYYSGLENILIVAFVKLFLELCNCTFIIVWNLRQNVILQWILNVIKCYQMLSIHQFQWRFRCPISTKFSEGFTENDQSQARKKIILMSLIISGLSRHRVYTDTDLISFTIVTRISTSTCSIYADMSI